VRCLQKSTVVHPLFLLPKLNRRTGKGGTETYLGAPAPACALERKKKGSRVLVRSSSVLQFRFLTCGLRRGIPRMATVTQQWRQARRQRGAIPRATGEGGCTRLAAGASQRSSLACCPWDLGGQGRGAGARTTEAHRDRG
jgi:hypothetical protein